MPNWKTSLNIKPTFDKFQEGTDEEFRTIRGELSSLLKSHPFYKTDIELRDIDEALLECESMGGIDALLDELYNWGDEDHRCFFGI